MRLYLSLWPANSFLYFFSRRIEGTSWCKNSVQIFSTLQKNCSTLFWRRQDRFWESVLREASDLVRASGCGESRNGGRWVSRDHPPPRPRWAKRAQKLGATHMWDCHTKGRVKHCHTWATHCQTWAKLGQHIVNHGPHTVKIGIQIA